MSSRSTPRESLQEETTKVRHCQLEEAQEQYMQFIRYQRCGPTKETMQAMTCVTGDLARLPIGPFIRLDHHMASYDEWYLRVLPLVLITVQEQRRDQDGWSRTLVIWGRYVASGYETPFNTTSWLLGANRITSYQGAHQMQMKSSAMPLGEHHNDFTPTMPEHDHRTLFVDDGAGIFHRTDTPYQPDLHVLGTYRSWVYKGQS